MAKTDKLKQSPWNNELKVGEHEIFFYNWFKKGNNCAICKTCYFDEVNKNNRQYPSKIKKLRDRSNSNDIYDFQKYIKLIF